MIKYYGAELTPKQFAAQIFMARMDAFLLGEANLGRFADFFDDMTDIETAEVIYFLNEYHSRVHEMIKNRLKAKGKPGHFGIKNQRRVSG